jgi:hypothetical protein
MIRAITGSTFFNIEKILLNPQNPALANWLFFASAVFETYDWRDLVFEWVPSCSTATSGVVGAYLDLDPRDDSASDSSAAQSQAFAITGPAWQGFSFNVLDVLKKARTTQPLGSGFRYCDYKDGLNQPINTFGALHLWTEGTPVSVLGHWWIKYHVLLATPNVDSSLYDTIYTFPLSLSSSIQRFDPFQAASATQISRLTMLGIEPLINHGWIFSTAFGFACAARRKWSVTISLHTDNAAGHVLLGNALQHLGGCAVDTMSKWWGVDSTGAWASGRYIIENNTDAWQYFGTYVASTNGPFFSTGEFDAHCDSCEFIIEQMLPGYSPIIPVTAPISQSTPTPEHVDLDEVQDVELCPSPPPMRSVVPLRLGPRSVPPVH